MSEGIDAEVAVGGAAKFVAGEPGGEAVGGAFHVAT